MRCILSCAAVSRVSRCGPRPSAIAASRSIIGRGVDLRRQDQVKPLSVSSRILWQTARISGVSNNRWHACAATDLDRGQCRVRPGFALSLLRVNLRCHFLAPWQHTRLATERQAEKLHRQEAVGYVRSLCWDASAVQDGPCVPDPRRGISSWLADIREVNSTEKCSKALCTKQLYKTARSAQTSRVICDLICVICVKTCSLPCPPQQANQHFIRAV